MLYGYFLKCVLVHLLNESGELLRSMDMDEMSVLASEWWPNDERCCDDT